MAKSKEQLSQEIGQKERLLADLDAQLIAELKRPPSERDQKKIAKLRTATANETAKFHKLLHEYGKLTGGT